MTRLRLLVCLFASTTLLAMERGAAVAQLAAASRSPAALSATSDAPVQHRLAALEAEIASLRSGMAGGSGVIPACAWDECGSGDRASAGCDAAGCGLARGCSSGDGSSLASCGGVSCRKAGGGLYGGAALIYAKPHFKEAFQISALNTATGLQTLIPFSYDYSATPEFWLGMERADGLGLRGRYWQFDQSGNGITRVSDGQTYYTANATTIIFPATIIANDAGEVLVSDDNLRTQVVDLEATLRMKVGRTEIVGGGGLRYAALTQSLTSTVLDAGGTMVGLLQWTRDFEGVGPCVSFDLRRPLGQSRFSAVAKVNAALLYGNKDLERTVVGDVTSPTAAPFLNLDGGDEVVGLGEVALGVQWRRPFRPGELVIGGIYQGQLWAEAGAPTLGFLGFEGFGFTAELRR